MRNLFYLVILLTEVSACNQTANHIQTASYKDSVVKEHLEYLKDFGEPDTTDLNYEVLNAYAKNDTAFFKQLHNDIGTNKKIRQQWDILDSCIHQPRLQDLNADKAFRFSYNSAFCPYRIDVTIANKGDITNLNFILYQPGWDTAKCRIIIENKKILTKKNWSDFEDAMYIADFWGLKRKNGLTGLDGDDIRVWGYEKGNFNRSPKVNYVERWLIAKSSLAAPFDLLLKFSGNKRGCLWVQ